MKIIDPEEIPERERRGAPLKEDVMEFLRDRKAKAAILKEYESVASARSTVGRLNAWANEEELSFRALSRGATVYLEKV